VTSITIEQAARTFGSVRAVDGVSIAIRDAEFFTLLGPSGCGKTTLLRMVAGFCDLDSGRVLFGDKRIDTLPPHQRNTGMVFQNYAIFPHLRVGDNVAYGLKARNVPADARADRIARALKLIQLEGHEGRWPHQLSGGQLQRVAIARAIVIEPNVLLLDEPLSNLDAKLRIEMRGEIRRLQKTLGITVIYVGPYRGHEVGEGRADWGAGGDLPNAGDTICGEIRRRDQLARGYGREPFW